MAESSKLPPCVFLMGPTASGKTGLAVEMVRRFPMDIISVDSALVFRGMDIGTAKPDADTLEIAPHRLIDIRDPAETYSAAEFRDDALVEMHKITAAGRIPLLVGGTMLYFRALEHGLSDLPAADPKVRANLEQQAETIGWQAMHDILRKKDPQAAARIHPNDPQRIQRALEVINISGESMSEMQARTKGESLVYNIHKIIVSPEDRAELHRRIGLRFDLMLEAGFMNEMKSLYGRSDLNAAMPSMRAVGYRQAWEYLEGQVSAAEMREKATAATRQLAKRQLTWLRRENASIWYDLQASNVQDKLLTTLGESLKLSSSVPM
jgi:tRNA dimethylallyltransferase